MIETPKFERLLKLLMTLSNGIKYSSGELMERFALPERTFYRDIKTLRNAGFAIENNEGRYWIDKLGPPFNQLHDLLFFTEEEAHIMTQAIHSIDEHNMLKKNLVNKLYNLYNFGKVAKTIIRRENSEKINKLAKAIKGQKQVLLRSYHSAHGNIIRDRLVEPFEFSSNYISVWAFDPGSRSNKLFKTARIKSVQLIEKPFLFASQHASLPLDVFRISGDDKIPVKLNLSLRAYNLLIEEHPLAGKYIAQLDDKLWQYDGWVCSFDGVGRFVMGLCRDVEIVAPKGLKDYVKEKASCLTK
jgi:predicted DNA-binding transcriptional regulator YafY